MTEITLHDRHVLDATVEVTLSDGSTVRREARDVPRTLIFQDRNQAMAVFERRVVATRSGAVLGGHDFAVLEQNAPLASAPC